MSWDGIDVSQYASVEEAIATELFAGSALKVIERGGVYYCAVDEGKGKVSASVVFEQTTGLDRMFKQITEEELPVALACPIEILRVLTPTKSGDANTWRELCWKWNSKVVDAALNGPITIEEGIYAEAFPDANPATD